MSYVSVFKHIPDFLSQPTGIAAIASVGIHGAIALIVPLMPADSKPKAVASSSAVGLIELTPKEQQLLPEAPKSPQVAGLPQPGLQSQISLPNIPPSSLATQYPPLPSLPSATSTQVVLPPLPKSSRNYSTNSLPKQTSLSFSKTSFPPISSFNAKKKISSISNYRPSYTTRKVKLGTSQPLPINRLPGGVQPSNINAELAKMPSSTTRIPTPPPPPVTSQRLAQKPQQNLIAPVGSAFKPGSNKIGFAPQALPPWQNRSPRSTNKLQSTPTQLAALNSYQDLRTSVRQQYPNVEEKAVIRKTIPTDKNGTKGTVLGGLVVDTEGKVVDVKFQQQQLIPSDLKIATREYFKKNPLQAHNKLSYYPFNLQFQNGGRKNPQIKPVDIKAPVVLQPNNNQRQASSSQVAKIKAPVVLQPNNNQRQASSSQVAKIKTPVVLRPNNNQQQASSSQAAKIKPLALRQPNKNPQQASSSQQVVKIKAPVALQRNNNQRQASSSESVKIKTPVVLQRNNNQRQASSSQSAKIKPLVLPQPNKKEGQEPAQQNAQKPKTSQQASNNQPSSTPKPNKLIQKLRQLREDK
ncbi:MAG: hypothetical protein QNJ47_14300 [Nostocaceae cyanobacterium]|nr:hypothetical protein [Nostocaceae cyanobacterium]